MALRPGPLTNLSGLGLEGTKPGLACQPRRNYSGQWLPSVIEKRLAATCWRHRTVALKRSGEHRDDPIGLIGIKPLDLVTRCVLENAGEGHWLIVVEHANRQEAGVGFGDQWWSGIEMQLVELVGTRHQIIGEPEPFEFSRFKKIGKLEINRPGTCRQHGREVRDRHGEVAKPTANLDVDLRVLVGAAVGLNGQGVFRQIRLFNP